MADAGNTFLEALANFINPTIGTTADPSAAPAQTLGGMSAVAADPVKAQLKKDQIAAEAAHKLLADPNQSLDTKTKALQTWNMYQASIKNNPLTKEQDRKASENAATQASLQGMGLPGGQQAAPGMDPLSFGMPGAGGAPAAQPAMAIPGMMPGQMATRNGMNFMAPMIGALPGAQPAPPVATVDPRALMAMVGGAPAVKHIKLAGPAQMDALPAAPEQAQLDPAMLDPMIKAMQPVAPDTSTRGWDRVRSLLTGAAAGATHADPRQGLGNFILNAGLGAGQNVTAFDQHSKEEDKQYNEAIRQANIIAETKKLDFGLKNLEIVQGNKEAQYKTQVANQKIKFDNAQSIVNTLNAQIKDNLSIDMHNSSEAGATSRARAQLGASAMEQNAAAVNAASKDQQSLNLYALSPKTSQATYDQAIAAAGIDPKRASTYVQNAAAASQAKNLPAALDAIAGDALADGKASAMILTPTKQDSQQTKTFKAKMTNLMRQSKKPGDQQFGQAQAMLTQTIQSMPHTDAYALVKQLSDSGLPSAKILLNHLTVPNAPAAQPK